MICYLITTSAAFRENVLKRFPLWHLQRTESAVWCLSLRMLGSLVSLSISFILPTNCLEFSSWCVGTSFWFAPLRGHVIWAISITLSHHLLLSTAYCSCAPTTYIWWDREGSSPQMWTGFFSTLWELTPSSSCSARLLSSYRIPSDVIGEK